MGASHTSNWDFLVFLGTVQALGRQVRFIGKHSLFKWPMGGFMRALGGVPVDRSSPQDLVSQIVAQFDAHDDFVLVIAPEGHAVGDDPLEDRLLPDRAEGRRADRLRRARLSDQARRHRAGHPPHRRLWRPT